MYALQENQPILIFRVGLIHCCASVGDIDSVVKLPEYHVLPQQSSAVLGVFRHRESTISIIDMYRKFGMPRRGHHDSERVVVAHTRHGDIGFLVDEVLEVTQQDSENWSEPPKFIGGNIFDRTLHWREMLVLSTDFNRLYAMEDAAPLHAWAKDMGLDLTKAEDELESPVDDMIDSVGEESNVAADAQPASIEDSIVDTSIDASVDNGSEPAPVSDIEPNTATHVESSLEVDVEASVLTSPFSNSEPVGQQDTHEQERIEVSAGPAELESAESFENPLPLEEHNTAETLEPVTSTFGDVPATHSGAMDSIAEFEHVQEKETHLKTESGSGFDHNVADAEESVVANDRSLVAEIGSETSEHSLHPVEVRESANTTESDDTEGGKFLGTAVALSLVGVLVFGGYFVFDRSGALSLFDSSLTSERSAKSKLAQLEEQDREKASDEDAFRSFFDNDSTAPAESVNVPEQVESSSDLGAMESSFNQSVIEEDESIAKAGKPQSETRVASADPSPEDFSQATTISTDTEPPPGSGGGGWSQHAVVKGDTLWALSGLYLGSPWRYPELVVWNGIRNPDLIYPGDAVRYRKEEE